MNSVETDPVAQAMQRLYQATTATVVAPEVELIVGRARAHRRNTAILAAFGAVAVVMLAVLVSGPLRASQSFPPVDPATNTPTPTVSRTPDNGRAPADLPLILALPPSTLLRPPPADWWGSGPTPTPCFGTPIDMYSVGGAVGDPDAPLTVSSAIYADAAAAHATFAGQRSNPQSCVPYGAGERAPTAESIGDEGFSLEYPKEPDGAGELAGMAMRVLAFRVGEIVTVLFSESRYEPESGLAEAATIQTIRAVALDLLPLLGPCDNVCARPADLPAPLEELTEGGRAWLVALDAFPAGQMPVDELHVAARLGYHPTVVSRGCDLGVEFIEGRLDTTRYLALYFATSSEANLVLATASALLPEDSDGFPRALEVTTLCVAS